MHQSSASSRRCLLHPEHRPDVEPGRLPHHASRSDLHRRVGRGYRLDHGLFRGWLPRCSRPIACQSLCRREFSVLRVAFVGPLPICQSLAINSGYWLISWRSLTEACNCSAALRFAEPRHPILLRGFDRIWKSTFKEFRGFILARYLDARPMPFLPKHENRFDFPAVNYWLLSSNTALANPLTNRGFYPCD